MRFPDIGGGSRTNAQGSGGNLFVKMKSGDKINGVFKGDPQIFRIHWIGGRSSLCGGKNQCEHCAAGDKAKFRFKLNLVSKIDGVWTAQIYEGGYQTYQELKALHEGGYDLEQTPVTISRTGEGTETKYKVIPLPPKNTAITPNDLKSIDLVPLNELKEREASSALSEDLNVEGVPF